MPQQKDVIESTVVVPVSTLSEAGSHWDQLKPRHPDIIKQLRPSLFLNELRADGLLTREECLQLQQESMSEADRSDMLVSTMLPQKGKGSFEAFCKILNNEEKQKHVVSKILKVPSEALLSVYINESPINIKKTIESDHDKISSSRK